MRRKDNSGTCEHTAEILYNAGYPYHIDEKDGYMMCKDDMPWFQTHPRRTRNVFLLLCVSGQAEVVYNTKKYQLHANMEWTLLPESIIHIQHTTPDFKVWYCVCLPSFFFNEVTMRMSAVFFDFIAEASPYLWSCDEEMAFQRMWFNLLGHTWNYKDNIFRHQIAVNILQSFYMNYYNGVKHLLAGRQNGYTAKDKLLGDFHALLLKHYREHRDVAWYAGTLCVSTRYLSQVVLQLGNTTPKKMIDDYLVREIQVQLSSTDATVQEIARYFNFTDQSVMGRLFRQKTGMSPQEYRKQRT